VADANPDDSEALHLLGSTQAGVGDMKGAIKTFERLTAKDKNSPDAYLRLALAQTVDKQFAPARANLERAIKIKPDHIQSHDALLRLELAEKKPDAALRIAKRIQALQPKAPIGYDREADILLSQKRAPEAVKAYQQALDRGAGATALVKQYHALNLAGDSKGADQRLKNWIQAHPDDLNTRLFAAGQYHRANRDREATTLYEDILKKSPNHVVTLNNLATLYQKAKDKRALSTAEQAYKLAPQSPEVQDTLGWILVEQGQIPRAEELLRAAASKLPNAGSVRYHYAVALAKSGKKAAARKEVEQALKTGQPFPEEDAAKGLLQSL
jgi:putative PEP-CTERM system TPR-repeat lipoprotein